MVFYYPKRWFYKLYTYAIFENNKYKLLEIIPMENHYGMMTGNNFTEPPMQTNLHQRKHFP